MRKYIIYLFILFLTTIFFSYRLTKVPQGITIDEAAFGYNAVLLSETLHDENGRFLPAFVLSINGKDWRQPVTQYFMAAYFKLFNASIYNLRFTSVIIVGISSVLMFILGKKLLGVRGGVLALLFFVTTPIVMIHAHLGLDNVMPVPFVLLWLVGLLLFEKKGKAKYLVISAISLGIGFYSYKGMRSFAPVWTVLTVIYLLLPLLGKKKKEELKRTRRNLTVFAVSVAPFYLITPLLEYKYAGAIFGQVNTKIDSVYKFLLSYISSFDPSFLFITGDEMAHHSTGVHGMLLLVSLPFFLFGLYQALKKNNFWKFLVICFFSGPLLFGFPGSIHRASRLMAFIPIYVLICTLGAMSLKRWKMVLITLIVLVGVNYLDFVNYYWYQYPLDTYHIFYDTRNDKAYRILKEIIEERGLEPYVDEVHGGDGKVINDFLRSMYFVEPLPVWEKEFSEFPEDGILLSRSADIPSLQKVGVELDGMFIYLKK